MQSVRAYIALPAGSMLACTYLYSYVHTTRHFSYMYSLNANVPACSGLPKGCVLSLSNAEWKEKAEVKLTVEEVFSNVLRVTVCVERKDAGTNDLTVSIDKEALVSQYCNS